MSLIIQTNINNELADDVLEKNRKDKEYLDYINNHIYCVKKSFITYFYPLLNKSIISNLFSTEEFNNAIIRAAEKIKNHDGSKLSDDEFDAYRAKYYPTLKERNMDDFYQKMIEEEYEKAWEHHYTVNDHHPKHWKDAITKEPIDMSLDAIIEMICDWEGMSLAFGTNTIEWYEKSAYDEKEAMTSNTKNIVEEILYNIIHK